MLPAPRPRLDEGGRRCVPVGIGHECALEQRGCVIPALGGVTELRGIVRVRDDLRGLEEVARARLRVDRQLCEDRAGVHDVGRTTEATCHPLQAGRCSDGRRVDCQDIAIPLERLADGGLAGGRTGPFEQVGQDELRRRSCVARLEDGPVAKRLQHRMPRRIVAGECCRKIHPYSRRERLEVVRVDRQDLRVRRATRYVLELPLLDLRERPESAEPGPGSAEDCSLLSEHIGEWTPRPRATVQSLQEAEGRDGLAGFGDHQLEQSGGSRRVLAAQDEVDRAVERIRRMAVLVAGTHALEAVRDHDVVRCGEEGIFVGTQRPDVVPERMFGNLRRSHQINRAILVAGRAAREARVGLT